MIGDGRVRGGVTGSAGEEVERIQRARLQKCPGRELLALARDMQFFLNKKVDLVVNPLVPIAIYIFRKFMIFLLKSVSVFHETKHAPHMSMPF